MNGDPRAVLWAWAYAAIPLAYNAGRAAGVTALVEALAEIRAAQPLVPPDRRVRTWEEQVAERVALYGQCARDGHERWGTRPWPGWDAMGPAQRAASMRWLLGTWEPQAEKRAA